MTSYYVSAPAFTIRVDVADGKILPSSARYIKLAYGLTWDGWLRAMQRKYGEKLRIEELP